MNSNAVPGYKQILQLGMPIYAGMLATTLVGLVDTAFMGKVGEMEQSAAGYGALFYLVLYVIGLGFALGLQIRIAYRKGAGQPEWVNALFFSAGSLMLVLGFILFLFCFFFSHSFFSGINSNVEIAALTGQYMQYRALGIPFTMLNHTGMALCVGTGNTRSVGFANLTSAALNFVLDYLLIFGNLGFPELGLDGAALASTLAEVGATLVYLISGWAIFRRSVYFTRKPHFTMLAVGETVRIGTPLMLQHILSIVAWFTFFTMIERTGNEGHFNVSIVLRNILAVCMMPAVALASVSNSQTSMFLGAASPQVVIPLVRRIAITSLGITLPTVILLYFFEKEVLGIFNGDASFVQRAHDPLKVVMAAILLFSVSQIWYSAISGTGKTWLALGIEIGCISLYLCYTFYATQPEAGRPLGLIWAAECVYALSIGLVSVLILRRIIRKWKTESLSSPDQNTEAKDI